MESSPIFGTPKKNRPSFKGFSPRMVFGLLFIFFGVILTLERSGYIENAWSLLRFWPVFLVFAGVAKVFSPAGDRSRFNGGLLILVGGWMTLEALGFLDISIFDLWPLLLVLVGIRFVWQGSVEDPKASRPSAPGEGASVVNAIAALGGATRRNNSADFRGGDLVAVMGGCEVDLRHAQIQQGPAVIDAFAFWGGVEVRVPEDWTVRVDGIALLGAYEDNTSPLAEDPLGPRQELVVKGMAIMGGVEIKN